MKIELPDKVAEQLRVNGTDKVKIELRNHDAVITTEASEMSLFQRISLWWYLAPAIISAIVFNVFFATKNQNQIPLSGNTSLGTTVILGGVVIGTLMFAIFFIRERRNQTNTFSANIYWRNFPVVILSFAVILGLALLGVFWLLGTIFAGATFDRLTSTIIFFIFESMINYLMIYAAFSISSRTLVRLFTLVIVSGAVIAMATNGTRKWWQYNLSFLGTHLANNSWQFNITLMFSALIMVALIDYIFVSLNAIYPHSIRLLTLRILLTAMSIDLGAVGFFPNNAASHDIHDRLASFLVYFIIILIVGIRWLLPRIPSAFLQMSYSVGAILVTAEVLFKFVGYLSLTAYEIIGFTLAFGWVVLLLQFLQELVDKGTRVFYVKAQAEQKVKTKDLD
ncbi:hypothetical protein [Secundilactobacillus silagei]|uniref:ABC transporter permease protein n=1 Tax=Secundilactobacillus silagei JCM 19001 TaxID=1302250 RepID=A0A1Z5IGG6_9LACO|nr:hypothetical protein [Secundilactobacillus silagei]TDG73425.1 hypothetical protein C5L25_000574 [Secundilactobacillus silagei JCM 19001]GAX00796.1 hypothetical protein IWT126_00811 [Secundilactobacillus silagei JCM 19001]